jgi:hypothetical protein
MTRPFYAGAPCFLTGCGWLNNKRLAELNPDDVCVNGQCQGRIENECPFYHHCGEIKVEDHLLGFFSTEEDPPWNRTVRTGDPTKGGGPHER